MLALTSPAGDHAGPGRGGDGEDEDPDRLPPLRPLRIKAGCWHLVAEGEDLRAIARRYYGSPHNWTLLRTTNGLVAEPRAGAILWIPVRLPGIPADR